MIKYQGSNFRVDQVTEANVVTDSNPWLYRIEMPAALCTEVNNWMDENDIKRFKANFSIWITSDEDLAAFLLRWSSQS